MIGCVGCVDVDRVACGIDTVVYIRVTATVDHVVGDVVVGCDAGVIAVSSVAVAACVRVYVGNVVDVVGVGVGVRVVGVVGCVIVVVVGGVCAVIVCVVVIYDGVAVWWWCCCCCCGFVLPFVLMRCL